MRNVTSFEGVAVPVAALEGIPLLEGLQPDELIAVAASMRFRELAGNSLLVGEGLPGQSMFVMVGGLANELASIARTPEARSRSVFAEGRLVGKLRRGDVVGAMALVSGEPHATTVKTVVPSAALELNADDFRELIARFPVLLANLNRILSGRLAESTRRQAERGRRGEAVALLAAPSSSAAVPDILTAARAASPGSVEAIDTGSSLEEALARLDDALLEHRTVVLVAELDPSGIGVLLEQVDRAVVVAGEAEAQGLPTAATAAAPFEVVLVAEAGATPRRREDVLRVFESAGGALAADDTAWLGRHLAKTKLGLALGAGGAKGYAHVGVLEVLERGRLRGRLRGRQQHRSDRGRVRRARDDRGRDRRHPSRCLHARGDRRGLQALAHRRVHRPRDDDAHPAGDHPRPLVRGHRDPVRGDGGRPQRRACPLPSATGRSGRRCSPRPRWRACSRRYEVNERRLVDGLALVPVPVDAVAAEGADVMVAVNLMSRDTLPAWPGEAPPEPEPKRPGSRMLETLLEVMDLSQLDTSVRNAAQADVAVTPRFGPSSWRDFELADLFLAAGRQAAEEQLPTLQSLARPQAAAVTT